jgi:hypothetical protein
LPKAKTNYGITTNKINFEELGTKDVPSQLMSKIQNYKSNRGFLSMTDDKTGYIYIAILSGKKNTGGYSIKVKSIEDIEGKTKVIVHENSPKPNMLVTDVITYPYTVVKATGITPNITVKNDLGLEYRNVNIIGASQEIGTLKSIKYIDKNVYITIKNEEGSLVSYYTFKGSTAEKSLKKLKIGQKILVNYGLGTPSKIGNSYAFPFSSIQNI